VAETTVNRLLMLRVSTHWQSDGTNISMLVKDMSRHKGFSHVRVSEVLRFIPICDLFTDSPSYHTALHIITYINIYTYAYIQT
jgi:hypothetical protein